MDLLVRELATDRERRYAEHTRQFIGCCRIPRFSYVTNETYGQSHGRQRFYLWNSYLRHARSVSFLYGDMPMLLVRR